MMRRDGEGLTLFRLSRAVFVFLGDEAPERWDVAGKTKGTTGTHRPGRSE